MNVASDLQFLISSGSEFHKTGVVYQNVLCLYIVRLHLGFISWDLLNERNDWAGIVVIARLDKEGTIPLMDLKAKSKNWWLSVSIISTQFFILNSFEDRRGLLVSEILITSLTAVDGRSSAIFRGWGADSRQRTHKRIHYLQKLSNVMIFRTLFTSFPTSFGQQSQIVVRNLSSNYL